MINKERKRAIVRVDKILTKRIKNILIIELGGLGDIILSIPILKNLRESLPEVSLTFLSYVSWAPILELVRKVSFIDEIILARGIFKESILFNILLNPFQIILCFCSYLATPHLRRDSFRTYIESFFLLKRIIKNKNFDLIINFSSNSYPFYGYKNIILLNSQLIPNIILLIKNIIFSLNFMKRFIKIHIFKIRNIEKHEIERKLNTLRKIGVEVNYKEPALFIPFEEEEYSRMWWLNHSLSEKDIVIGFYPGGSKPVNRWGEDKFAQLGDRLIEECGAKIIIFVGWEQKVLKVLFYMKHEPLVCRVPIEKMAVLIKKCNLFISNDTGPAHLSMAVDTPTIVIFGPTNPTRWGPINNKKHIAVKKEISCSPCYEYICKNKKGYEHVCMNQITVEEVLEVVKLQIKRHNLRDKVKI